MESKIIKQARRYALTQHKQQTYGQHPFIYHLAEVVKVLQRYSIEDENLLSAAWLHDVLEDTPTDKGYLKQHFGESIANLVDAVTDGSGTTRQARKQRPYLLISQNPDALLIKVADRISNVEKSIAWGQNFYLARYQKEHFLFKESLYSLKPTKHGKSLNLMWIYLDGLLEKNIFLKK
jgi:(p)ppGpp synthase/HD superfamily hydrolase